MGGQLLVASALSLVLLSVVALGSEPVAHLENASLDLKHRLVAMSSGSYEAAADAGFGVRPAGAPGGLGVNVFLEQEVEPAKRDRSLDLLASAGVSWIRQQMPWAEMEPVSKGVFLQPGTSTSTWDKYDQIVDGARARGLRVVLRLDTSPRWALAADSPTLAGPPLRDEDYWDFVRAVAEHFKGRVEAYQIWNEPNLASEWGLRSPDPAGYVRLLSGAAERLREADPDARVMSAALAPTLTQSADAWDDLLYWQGLYDAGVRGSFDILAVQDYGLRGGPDDRRVGAQDVNFSRPVLVRELMVRNGDGGLPVWATEAGWDAPPATLPTQRFGRVTPILQARYTVRGLTRIHSEWPWLEAVALWYWKRVDDAERAEDWYWYRLADPDFTLQPVFYALRDAHLEGVSGW